MDLGALTTARASEFCLSLEKCANGSSKTCKVFTARCDASAVFAVTQCLSVCLSVTFVDHVKTNKDIFEIFSPSDSDTILVFPSQIRPYWRRLVDLDVGLAEGEYATISGSLPPSSF